MAPSLEEIRNEIRFALDEFREEARGSAESIINPSFAQPHQEEATRVGQVIAFFLLGPVIVVSLQIIVVINQFMTDILGVQPLGAGQDPIFAWLITGITGGLILLAAWFWFHFVRTAAFGFTRTT